MGHSRGLRILWACGNTLVCYLGILDFAGSLIRSPHCRYYRCRPQRRYSPTLKGSRRLWTVALTAHADPAGCDFLAPEALDRIDEFMDWYNAAHEKSAPNQEPGDDTGPPDFHDDFFKVRPCLAMMAVQRHKTGSDAMLREPT